MRVEVPFLDLPAQHRALRKELIDAFSAAIDRAAFVGGPEVEAFEADFASFLGCRHAIGVGNGTDALHIALRALGVGREERVITVPNTFIATTEAISLAGARFEFVDIDPTTCLMDANRLEDHLKEAFDRRPKSERPVCMLPVHLYGQPCDMDPILELAARYDMKVLEDAAQAHGAEYKGRPAGTLGHAAAFSFYPGKNLGACGEAGAITCSDRGVAERARMLRDHGQRERYIHSLEGSNCRLDAIQAAFLRVKLPRLQAWNASRRDIARRYDAAFEKLEGVRSVRIREETLPSRHLYVVHAERRDALRAFLAARGVQTGLHYPLPLHLQECYGALGMPAGAFPAAEWSASRTLSLPIFPAMAPEQIEAVIRGVTEFVSAC